MLPMLVCCGIPFRVAPHNGVCLATLLTAFLTSVLSLCPPAARELDALTYLGVCD